jgi:hypothetical protein
MKIVGTLAAILAFLSILASVWIAVDTPACRAQALRLEFPLHLQEGALAMALPMGLASAAFVGGLIAFRRKQGRLAVAVGLTSWLLIWVILGNDGFRYLF